MDTDNLVVRLCVDGMRAEAEGRNVVALTLFRQAWEGADDDYERAIAAHYLARQQPTIEDALWWNEESLRCARAVGDARVESFFPSLLLNLGDSLERLGRTAEAHKAYLSALTELEAQPAELRPEHVRASLEKAVRRTEEG
jgi:tetratricopeptide (TPR) repeat protein